MTQLTQQISHLFKPSSQLPGQTEPNPKEHIHAISLRSGKKLQEPRKKVTEQKKSAVEVIRLSEEDQGEKVMEDEAKKTEKQEPTHYHSSFSFCLLLPSQTGVAPPFFGMVRSLSGMIPVVASSIVNECDGFFSCWFHFEFSLC